jgi:hypothetical protein
MWTMALEFPTEVMPTVSGINVGLSNGSSQVLPPIFLLNDTLLCFFFQELDADNGVVNRVRNRNTVNAGVTNAGTPGYQRQQAAGFSGVNTNFT